MRSTPIAILLAALAGCASAKPASLRPDGTTDRTVDHVIVVSIDGLMPATYLDPPVPLSIPTLRRMAAEGAAVRATRSVFPSVTYPSHTTMVTGVLPDRHGIHTNHAWDPLDANRSGWRWYAEEIASPPIWRIAGEHGLTSATVAWPVTVGAQVTYRVPEYWRNNVPDDFRLLRALSTPGLLDAVARRFPDFYKRLDPRGGPDDAWADVAVHILTAERPNLLFLHLVGVDHYQHQSRPWSAPAVAAIEHADAQLARLIAACKQSGIWSRTALVVVSDHGFQNFDHVVRPGALLREHGFVTMSGDRRPLLSDWKAVAITSGGSAYLYLKDESDTATARRLEELFRTRAADPASGIARVLDRKEIANAGGDPGAYLALEAAPGYVIRDGYPSEFVTHNQPGAAHGWHPERPEMAASLLIYGPAIAPGQILDTAGLIDVAPTVARWLRLPLPDAAGRPLPIRTLAPDARP